MEIIGIDGSPRKESVTSRLLTIALEEAQREGAYTELVRLRDFDIRPCKGCASYNGRCNLEECLKQEGEGVVPLLERLIRVDGVIFGSPVYWFGPSGLMKNLIDRMTCLEHEEKLLDGKVAGLIFNYEDEGASIAIGELFLTLSDMGFLFPPYSYTYNQGKEIDPHTEAYIRQMGKNMVRLIKDTIQKKWWWIRDHLPQGP